MTFNFKAFLLELAEITPAAIVVGKAIAANVPNESKSEIASQSATALSQLTGAVDPGIAPEVTAANQIAQNILTAIATKTTP